MGSCRLLGEPACALVDGFAAHRRDPRKGPRHSRDPRWPDQSADRHALPHAGRTCSTTRPRRPTAIGRASARAGPPASGRRPRGRRCSTSEPAPRHARRIRAATRSRPRASCRGSGKHSMRSRRRMPGTLGAEPVSAHRNEDHAARQTGEEKVRDIDQGVQERAGKIRVERDVDRHGREVAEADERSALQRARVGRLPPALHLEPHRRDQRAERDHGEAVRVAMRPLELRHRLEIHPVQGRHEGRRDADHRDHGEHAETRCSARCWRGRAPRRAGIASCRRDAPGTRAAT